MEHGPATWDDTWARAYVFRCPPLAGGTSDYSLWFSLARLVLMFVCIILRIYINFGSPFQGLSDSASNAVRLPLQWNNLAKSEPKPNGLRKDYSELINFFLQ